MALLPGSHWVASATADGVVQLWDAVGRQQGSARLAAQGRADTEDPAQAQISSLAAAQLGPGSYLLASTHDDCTVRLWPVSQAVAEQGQLAPSAVLRGHKDEAWGVAFSQHLAIRVGDDTTHARVGRCQPHSFACQCQGALHGGLGV